MLTSTLREHVSHPGSFITCLLLLVGAAAGCESTQGGTTTGEASVLPADASQQDDVSQEDASEEDAGMTEDLDGSSDADAEDASTPHPMPEVEAGQPCQTDEQCDDHVYCNGAERCVAPDENADPICQPASRLPCSTDHPCREALHDCECSDKDKDKDNYVARECGGEDCNDGRVDCFPGATEVCDLANEDEDCDPTTYHNQSSGENLDGDVDGDGRIDQRCRNQDPETREWHGGTDCLDREPTAYPGAQEICDYFDNNCNGFIDERTYEDGTYDHEDNGLRNTFAPDLDGDLHGDANAQTVKDCIYIQPPGYILATNQDDCDDQQRAVYTGAPEVCDGVDNDCDKKIDKQDSDFVKEHFFPETVVDCREGHEAITECPDDKLWCPENGDPLEQGCRSDGTRLSSCRACNTDCKFSCGAAGCDELVKIAVGGNQSCALTRDGRVTCWGRGSEGRLGNDSTAQSSRAVWVTGISDARNIAVGYDHACAVVGPDRTLWCWGNNADGQVGVEEHLAFPTAVRVVGPPGSSALTQIASLSAGFAHTCAVQDGGQLLCFGLGTGGRLANGANDDLQHLADNAVRRTFDEEEEIYFTRPVEDALAVMVGDAHGCALLQDRTVECWGDNQYGQLGSGRATTEPALGLEPVPGLAGVEMLTAGSFHTCALTGGKVFCWGRGRDSQLGRAPGDDEATPKAVPGLDNVLSIAAGREFTCARTSANRIACWGTNTAGQLGNTAQKSSTTPLWLPVDDVVSLSSTGGWDHLCAQRADQTVFCWGGNFYGQTGTGTQSSFGDVTFDQILPVTGQRP